MKAQAPDGSYTVIVMPQALREFDRSCAAARELETGGVLIGRYSDDRTTAIVVEATSPPPDSRQGRAWFQRGIAGIRDLLQQRWRARKRSYYLGEWHYHPVQDVVPSSDDFEQMASIANANNYRCREPLMVILGDGQTANGTRIARIFVCPVGQSPTEVFPETSPDDR